MVGVKGGGGRHTRTIEGDAKEEKWLKPMDSLKTDEYTSYGGGKKGTKQPVSDKGKAWGKKMKGTAQSPFCPKTRKAGDQGWNQRGTYRGGERNAKVEKKKERGEKLKRFRKAASRANRRRHSMKSQKNK